MSNEYVIEIIHQPKPFSTIKQAKEWIKKNTKKSDDIDVNIVSRDITVVTVWGSGD